MINKFYKISLFFKASLDKMEDG